MRRLLVARRIVVGVVDLDEDEPRWIVVLLDDVEADDARLLDAVAGVLDGRGPEGVVAIPRNKADVVLKRAEEIALREQRMLPLIRKHKSVGEAIKAYNWI